MQINIASPVQQTVIFIILFLVIVLFSVRRKAPGDAFPIDLTNGLKGFAILAIVFSHIGYFLATDTRFLFPLSIAAGVGVDIFLLLSGYGLTHSMMKRPMLPVQFYHKRLVRLFLPLWIVLLVLYIADAMMHGIVYPINSMLFSMIGFIPHADLFSDVNSPLWFITLLLFFYILFPLMWFKKKPWLSAGLLFILAYGMLHYLWLPVSPGVYSLYRLHYWSFPLGMILAFAMMRGGTFVEQRLRTIEYARYVFLAIFVLAAVYLLFHAGIGAESWYQQLISLATVIDIVLVAVLMKLESRLLILFGTYSFEVYLLHWPLMYRYDFLYRFLPASIATILYLGVFILLSLALHRIVETILGTHKKPA